MADNSLPTFAESMKALHSRYGDRTLICDVGRELIYIQEEMTSGPCKERIFNLAKRIASYMDENFPKDVEIDTSPLDPEA